VLNVKITFEVNLIYLNFNQQAAVKRLLSFFWINDIAKGSTMHINNLYLPLRITNFLVLEFDGEGEFYVLKKFKIT